DATNGSPAKSSNMHSRTQTISRISSVLTALYSIRVSTWSPSRCAVTVKPLVPVWVMVPFSAVVSVVVMFCFTAPPHFLVTMPAEYCAVTMRCTGKSYSGLLVHVWDVLPIAHASSISQSPKLIETCFHQQKPRRHSRQCSDRVLSAHVDYRRADELSYLPIPIADIARRRTRLARCSQWLDAPVASLSDL